MAEEHEMEGRRQLVLARDSLLSAVVCGPLRAASSSSYLAHGCIKRTRLALALCSVTLCRLFVMWTREDNKTQALLSHDHSGYNQFKNTGTGLSSVHERAAATSHSPDAGALSTT